MFSDTIILMQRSNRLGSLGSYFQNEQPQISFCRMGYMPMVWPTLNSDLKKLKQV
jgi:hypothetical protein